MTQNPDPQTPESDLQEAQQHLEQADRILREALEQDGRLSAKAGELQ